MEPTQDAHLIPVYAAAPVEAPALAPITPPEPASEAPSTPISDARREANRRNARKSTGPRSAEGKARASRNALKHGYTAETHVVAPTEDPEDYRRQLDGWLADTDARGHLETSLVATAFDAYWKLRRLSRQEAADARLAAGRAADEHDAALRRKAIEQGERLVFEPVDRCAVIDLNDPLTLDRISRREKDDPAILALEMETYAQGLQWKIDRWLELVPMLNEEGFLHFDMRFRAIRLLGKRPEDVMHDPVVFRLLLLCNALHPQAWAVWDDTFQCVLTERSRGAYYHRVNLMAEAKPDPDAAWTELTRFIQAEHDRLQAKLAALKPRDEAERAEAAERALLPSAPDAPLRLRYAAHNERTLHRTLDQLIKLRKNPLGEPVHDHEEDPEAPPTPEPVATPVPPPAPASAPEPPAAPPEPETAEKPAAPSAGKRRPRRPRNEPKQGRLPGQSDRVAPDLSGTPDGRSRWA